MDKGDASNAYADHGRRSYHCCTRCIDYFARGGNGGRFNGKRGCRFVRLSATTRPIFKNWKEMHEGISEQYMKCERCFFNNDDCFALPDGYDEECDLIEAQMTILEDPASTDVQKSDASSAVASTARSMAKSLALGHSPFSKKLYLHSGACASDSEPRTGLRPQPKNRDTISTVARAESNKRKLEVAVAAHTDSPRKKKTTLVDGEKRAAQALVDRLVAEKAVLEASKLGVTGAAKGAITRSVKAKENEIVTARAALSALDTLGG